MTGAEMSRLQLLFNQNRYQEAVDHLRLCLEQDPTDFMSRYYLSYSYYLNNNNEKARNIAEPLVSEYPEEREVIALIANIDIAEDKPVDAEQKARFLISHEPESEDFHLLLGRSLFSQRRYDSALVSLDKSLEIEADNTDALNLRATIEGLLGDKVSVSNSVEKLLALDPENPNSIANDGIRLLNQGKVNEALARLEEALHIQPSNQMARYGMQEALKSRFFLYKLFYKYISLMSRLGKNQAWAVIIGLYIGYQVIRYTAEKSSGAIKIILTATVFILTFLFFLSWIINPLMNLYLFTNRYGILLLEEKEKTMAKLTGLSLLLSILSFCLYAVTQTEGMLLLGIVLLFMMIPAGTFLLPGDKKKQDKLKLFGIFLLSSSLLGIFIMPIFLSLAALGFLGYQFYFNALMINDFSRNFD